MTLHQQSTGKKINVNDREILNIFISDRLWNLSAATTIQFERKLVYWIKHHAFFHMIQFYHGALLFLMEDLKIATEINQTQIQSAVLFIVLQMKLGFLSGMQSKVTFKP